MIFNHIENKTEKLLRQYNLLIPGFNVTRLAEKIGVTVEGKIIDDDVSGLLVIKNEKAYIVYNAKHSKPRKRFTIAHELGHYHLHSKNKPLFVDKTREVMYRNTASSTGEYMKEREANAFAAALLMPRCLIENYIKEFDDFEMVVAMSKKFNVSTQAMSFRLSNLGYEFGMF
jgi:Zn-dependent peptidase ImmA (M78 family)